MSKSSGTGQKRMGARLNKGMDKCDVGSHSKQCGREKKVSKGKKWTNEKKETAIFESESVID